MAIKEETGKEVVGVGQIAKVGRACVCVCGGGCAGVPGETFVAVQ